MRHLDATEGEEINKFQTGTPTKYEKERIHLVDHLKKQRKKDLIDTQRAYEGSEGESPAMRQGEAATVAEGAGTTTGRSGVESSYIPSPDAGKPKVKPIITGLVHGSGFRRVTDESGSVVDTADLADNIRLDAPIVVAAVISGPVEIIPHEESKEPTKSMLRRQYEEPIEEAVIAQEESPEEATEEPAEEMAEAEEMAAVESAEGEPRIKIVSGDGMPLSAKQLSMQMKDMGYNVDRVDVAPFDFDKPTVFYAPGFKGSAESLAQDVKAIGGVKPLTWKSIYDIIVVSVN